MTLSLIGKYPKEVWNEINKAQTSTFPLEMELDHSTIYNCKDSDLPSIGNCLVHRVKILKWEQLRITFAHDIVNLFSLGNLCYSCLSDLRVLELSDCQITALPSVPDSVEVMIFKNCQFHKRSVKSSKFLSVDFVLGDYKKIELGGFFRLSLPKKLKTLELIDCQRSKLNDGRGRNWIPAKWHYMFSYWEPIDDQLLATIPSSLECFKIQNANITETTLKKLPSTISKFSIQGCPNIEMSLQRASFLFPNAKIKGLIASTNTLEQLQNGIQEGLCGQPLAVTVGARAILLAKENQPLNGVSSVILCSGPSGVGKTEFAMMLGKIAGRNVDYWSMDQYDSPEKTWNLFGSPIGYKGSSQGSPLANAVLKNPDTIILFDEIEKAHPNVLRSLLTILSSGCMETNERSRVDFSKTTIILTSNLGKKELLNLDWEDEEKSYPDAQKIIEGYLIQHTSEEFRGRITDIVPFKPLSKKALCQVINKHLNIISENVKKNDNFHLTINNSVWLPLIDKYNPKTGARGPINALKAEINLAIIGAKADKVIKSGDKILLKRNEKGKIVLTSG